MSGVYIKSFSVQHTLTYNLIRHARNQNCHNFPAFSVDLSHYLQLFCFHPLHSTHQHYFIFYNYPFRNYLLEIYLNHIHCSQLNCPGYNSSPAFCQVKFLPVLTTIVWYNATRYPPYAKDFEAPLSLLLSVFPRSYCQQA